MVTSISLIYMSHIIMNNTLWNILLPVIIIILLLHYMKSEAWPMQHSGWRGPQEVSSPISCPQEGHLRAQTRLLRAISKTAEEGEHTASVDRLFHCLSVHVGIKVFLTSDPNLSSFISVSVVFQLSNRHVYEELCPVTLITACRYWMAAGSLWNHLSSRLKKPSPLTTALRAGS